MADIPEGQAAEPRKKKRRRRLPKNFKPTQIESILAAAEAALGAARTKAKRLAARRDLVMFQTIRYTGFRISELCKLRIENVDLADGVIAILHGKGDADRNVPINRKLLPLLVEWIGDRRSGFVFPGRGDRPIASRTFQRRLPALAKAAGFVITKDNKANPHRLRHTFATSYLKVNKNLREVQELLGHANLQTTAIYLHVDQDELKEGIDRL